jgi:hypothetical protein
MYNRKPSTAVPARPAGGGGEIPEVLKDMLKGGLSLLWRGFEYARDLETDGWKFAVGRDLLCQSGLSDIDLRWLIARGYVEIAPSTAANVGEGQLRAINFPPDLDNSGFVLTKAGAALAVQLLSPPLARASSVQSENMMLGRVPAVSSEVVMALGAIKQKPSWDRERKELRFGQWIIKQFRWLAVNQETILMAFEEEGWPLRIDDPLPRKLNQDPKHRLHDTIKCLNRNHKKRLIRFNGDGTGEGILWTLLECAELGS